MKSTTYEKRNIETLESFNNILQSSTKKYNILIIGSGAVLEKFKRFYLKDTKKGFFELVIRNIESFIRKNNNNLKYVNYEVLEIISTINEHINFIDIIDIEQKVLDSIPENELINEKILLDITKDKIPQQYEVIICFNTISRVNNKTLAIRNIIQFLIVGGYLLITESDLSNISEAELEKLKNLEKNIFQKIS